MNTRLFSPVRRLILAGALTSACAAAAESVPSENIRQGEVKQQQLQGEASGLAGQLEAMLGEYKRNGLGGEEVETIKGLRDSLNRLSATEMQQVVSLLEKARSTPDAGAAKKVVSDAFAAQKGILVQMKRLLAEHQRNQQAIELSNELGQLADRQSANLQNGIELGKWAGGKKPENFETALQAHLDGQKSEEDAIGEELKILADKIAAFGKAADLPDQAARFQKGVDAAKNLLPGTQSATEALAAGQLFKAVTDEKSVRDAMRKLAREVAPDQDPQEALRHAERELDRLTNEQKEIAANAAKSQIAPNFDQWLQQQIAANAGKNGDKRFQKPLDQLRQDHHLQENFDALKRDKAAGLSALDDPQADLANKTDLAMQDLDKNAAAAAQALKGAIEKMQETRGAVADQNAAAAEKNANAAAAALEAAHAQVAQLTGEKAPQTPEQTINGLQRLEQDAKELAKREAAAAANPDKSQQAALTKQIQQFAQLAGAAAPNAAPALQQAAEEAQQAAAAAQAGQPAQAAAAQQAAAQALGKADQQLGQQLGEGQKAQQELAEAKKVQESLTTIIKAEQALERDTATAAALSQQKKEGLFKGQNDRQEDIQTRTGTFKGGLDEGFIAALSALTDATIDMGEAKAELDKPSGQTADDAEKKALEDLYRAQEIVGKKAEAEEAELGQPASDAAALAAKLAAKAEGEAVQAMQTMQKAAAQQGAQAAATMKQAAQELGKAAEDAGQIAAAGGPLAEAAQQAAQQAAQDLGQAAAQATAQNAPGAQTAAQQGQQDLDAFMAALGQAEAGLAQVGVEAMPGEAANHEGPPHPDGKPGNHPGEVPGKPGSKAAKKYQPGGEEAVQRGTRKTSERPANFAGLPPRERAAIEQAQSEKYPEEYGPQVEQYLRNLASESSSASVKP